MSYVTSYHAAQRKTVKIVDNSSRACGSGDSRGEKIVCVQSNSFYCSLQIREPCIEHTRIWTLNFQTTTGVVCLIFQVGLLFFVSGLRFFGVLENTTLSSARGALLKAQLSDNDWPGCWRPSPGVFILLTAVVCLSNCIRLDWTSDTRACIVIRDGTRDDFVVITWFHLIFVWLTGQS